MTAEEALKRLKRCVNIAHYIGPNAAKLIDDACEEKVVVEKPVLKALKKKAKETPTEI